MVKIINVPMQGEKTGCQRGLIVEIVGPAGAGKSTLFQALEKLDPVYQTEFLPPVWNFWYIPFFVKHIILLIPTLIRMQGKGDRNLTRRELAWMAILKGWPKILRKKEEDDHKVILLDQGPIFLMAILSEFGPESLHSSKLQGYWEEIMDRWIHTLDLVIWLEASDEILIERIRNRRDEHVMKDKTDQEIIDFLEKYRGAYDRFIDTMETNNSQIGVLRLDTGKTSVNDLVNCVMEVIREKWN